MEFTPLPGYGFEKWLAFPSAEYTNLDKTQTAVEAEAFALNGNGVGVAIETSQSDSGTAIATVTIYTDIPVTIVPWCSSRPALDQRTNPPINPILTPFPYDQRVNIWFTLPVDTTTITLDGESPTIRITGLWASGNDRGEPFNRNGENGDLRAYFDLEFPTSPDPAMPLMNNRVTLVPKANASEIALVAITITVGPGIESSSGVAMTVPGTISYQTNTSKARAVYRAGNVIAREAGTTADYFRDAEFSRPDIDRRFTQHGGSGKNTVDIRFDVAAPEGAPDVNPNRIIIVERRLHSLRGFDLNPGSTVETSYIYPGPGVSLDNNSFTIAHTLKTEQSGIVQLAVLPWYAGTPAVEEMPISEAISEGRYVTIVVDNAAPDVENPQASLSTPSSMDNSVFVYGPGVAMTLTLGGLSGIVDNGIEGGIPASRAYSLPWTMDEAENLSWHGMIGENATTVKIPMPDAEGRKPVYNSGALNHTWTLPNLSGLDEGTVYQVYVKYEDALGNITPTWTATGLRVMYSTATKATVTAIKAYCNTDGNEITVSWDENLPGWATASGTYPYPELVITTYRASANGDIEEGTQTIASSRGVGAYSFTVPQIVSNQVREGEAVSNVYGYKISIVTRNVAGDMEAGPIWVYNIPEMATAESAIPPAMPGDITYLPLEHISDTVTATVLACKKNFVLTHSTIILSNHEPIGGDGTGINPPPFQGKFYGNGHTVTINSFTAGLPADIGLFGVINDGTVRDLTVQYNTAQINPTNSAQFGGIAGTVSGNVELSNVLVKGTATVSGINNGNDTNTVKAGGLVGAITGTSSILNAYGGLNLTVEHSGGTSTTTTGNSIYIGGLAGWTEGSLGNVHVEEASVIGNITVGSSTAPVHTIDSDANNKFGLLAGGLVGYSTYTVLNDLDCNQGTFSVTSGNGTVFIGGAIGKTDAGTEVDACFSAGTLSATKTGTGTYFYVGGFVGDFFDGDTKNCYSTSAVIITRNTGYIYAGGFTGRVNSDISYCYAEVDLTIVANGNIYAGGFSGITSAVPLDIKYSYATGEVTVINQTGLINALAGGFVGSLNMNMEHCYALGNVIVHKGNSQADIYAGSLVGGQPPNSNVVSTQHCFATGTVTVHNIRTSSGTTRASGLMGYIAGTNIAQYNVALGQNVTATGANIRRVGRVFGESTGTGNRNNNYALDGMQLFCDSKYNPSYPSLRSDPVASGGNNEPIDNSPSSKDGSSTFIGDFSTSTFWTNLGFADTYWDYSTVASRRHPVLKSSDGGILGGSNERLSNYCCLLKFH